MITSNFLSVSVHTLITKQAIKICFRLEKLQRERVIEGQLIFFFFRIGAKISCYVSYHLVLSATKRIPGAIYPETVAYFIKALQYILPCVC